MWAKKSDPLPHPDTRSVDRLRALDAKYADASGETERWSEDRAMRDSERDRDQDRPRDKLPAPKAKSGAWALTFGLLLVLVWFGGVAAAIGGYLLGGGALALPDWAWALGGVGVVTVGGVIWLGALVVREGVRARSAAERLHAAADLLLSPASVAEASMRRLGAVIRHEIATMDRTLAEALTRLQSVEQSLSRHTGAISGAANAAETGANALVGRLDGHAKTLTDIAAMLKSRADEINAVSTEQTDRVGQTLTHADVVLRDIEARMSKRVGEIDAAITGMGAKSEQFQNAAKGVAQKAQMLDSSLGEALHTIATASRLVDMSKDSTAKAADAARATADAVQRGVGEALERATAAVRQLRADAEATDAAGRASLAQLREAGDAARVAADNARAAADAYAAQVQRRIQELSQAVFDAAARSDRYADAKLAQALRDLQSPAVFDPHAASSTEPFATRATDAEFRAALDAAAPSLARPPVEPTPQSGAAAKPGAWSWRDVLATADAPAAQPASPPSSMMSLHASASLAPPSPLVNAPQAPTRAPGLHMGRIAAAFDDISVNPFTAIAGEALHKVVSRLGNGAIARRRAVREAAPETVLRIRSRLLADTPLREAASAFLAERDPLFDALSPDAARRAAGEAETAEGRAFLLLDAAMR